MMIELHAPLLAHATQTLHKIVNLQIFVEVPQSSIVVFAIYPKDAVLPHSAFLRPSFLMFVFQAFHDLLG